jgi:glycosyltransferase involved in cell wall biosynthesis
MPVYNAERTVSGALESLLGQTFGDFELVVSDNASTDGTPDVLARYSALDRRIRLIRQPRNIGANPNYSAVARCARGAYFKWASSNDWCAPTLLERCVAVLERNADAVLAFSRTKLFVDTPDRGEEYAEDFALPNESAAERFVALSLRLKLNNVMNGVIRASALRRTRLVEPYYGADVVLMGHLALLGKFVMVPEALYFRQMDRATATKLKSKEEVRLHHFPVRDVRSLFQTWRRFAGWYRVVLAAPIPLAEKQRALRHVTRLFRWGRWDLASDLHEAARYFFRRSEG